jgi:CheY-like chemotaxis protein
MSHEMRTPLGVIIGFTDLLMESIGAESEQQQGLKTIHRNGFHLLSLIDDLLDLAKIEAGQMSMEKLVMSLPEELQSILAQFAPKAKDKRLELTLNCAPDLPEKICTDPIRFRQIVLNILSNALKFTDHGSVSITAFVEEPLAGGKALLNIDIKDSGCGIPGELQHLLFRPFAQAEESTSRMFGGTGLGLFLSKRLAEALGGSLHLLRSESGAGSTFRITIDLGLEHCIPSDNEEDDLPIPPPLPSLKGIRVLVVEDGIDNQVLIRKLLEMAGAEVDCADDGEKAVIIATSNNFDVVLMDIQMPLMDGYTAATQIRSRGCQTPIVALTAHALMEDRMKAEQFGFDGFLSKPIDWFKLAGTIARCRSKPSYDCL